MTDAHPPGPPPDPYARPDPPDPYAPSGPPGPSDPYAPSGPAGPPQPGAPGTAPPAPPALAKDAGGGAGRDVVRDIRTEVGKVVVGQDPVLACLLAALLVRGHVLLEGVPGVAKTLLVKTLAATLDLDVNRIQFTPDLLPSDVTGQLVLEGGTDFTFREGPIFTNLLLADEINRTPPKAQAALLEAMEERQVSVGGVTRLLPEPFVVVATQNPVEYEGTYPLPEAQLDRFLFKVVVPYPSGENEVTILRRHNAGMDVHDPASAGVRQVASVADIERGRQAVSAVRVDDVVITYLVQLARATREAPSVALGVSPRGAAALLHATKAWAWLSGREFVTPDDVKAVAKPAMRHRLQIRPEAALEGLTPDRVIDGLLATVPAPR
ncbi:MAG TPA: MoxR family ATPase [Iamia sp.]|nr:MoxR family ATPase [Iamia sp.]